MKAKTSPIVQKGLLFLYLIVAIGCLIGRLIADPLSTQLDYIFKPLLMPILAAYLLLSIKQEDYKKYFILLIALFFAWGGDVFLMIGREGIQFLLGLGSFLIMQILYIIIFSKKKAQPSLLKQKFYLALPYVAIGLGFYLLAVPQLLDDSVMLIAVFVYASALTTMSILALNRKGAVPFANYWSVLIGASLFLASDLMIGINKFIWPNFPFAGFAIMTTYILAQYLIVNGLIKRF
jgi:uncharacterized membrane protein YhhN